MHYVTAVNVLEKTYLSTNSNHRQSICRDTVETDQHHDFDFVVHSLKLPNKPLTHRTRSLRPKLKLAQPQHVDDLRQVLTIPNGEHNHCEKGKKLPNDGDCNPPAEETLGKDIVSVQREWPGKTGSKEDNDEEYP